MFVISGHWTLIIRASAICVIGSFVLGEGGCSVVAVTFMSRGLCNHVLLRVGHLANRIFVFLEPRVFSSLAKLLQVLVNQYFPVVQYFQYCLWGLVH